MTGILQPLHLRHFPFRQRLGDHRPDVQAARHGVRRGPIVAGCHHQIDAGRAQLGDRLRGGALDRIRNRERSCQATFHGGVNHGLAGGAQSGGLLREGAVGRYPVPFQQGGTAEQRGAAGGGTGDALAREGGEAGRGRCANAALPRQRRDGGGERVLAG